jgi:hypothetical protein
MSCFSFYLFSSAKSENRRVEKALPRGEGWHQWEGKEMGKGGRGVNMVQILCTFVCKYKMIPAETAP